MEGNNFDVEEKFYLLLSTKLLGAEYVTSQLSEWTKANESMINRHCDQSINSRQVVTSRDQTQIDGDDDEEENFRCLYWRSFLLDVNKIREVRNDVANNSNADSNTTIFVDIRFQFGDRKVQVQHRMMVHKETIESTTNSQSSLIGIRFGIMYLNSNNNIVRREKQDQTISSYYVVSKNPLVWDQIQHHFTSLAIDVKNTPIDVLANIMSQSLNSINKSVLDHPEESLRMDRSSRKSSTIQTFQRRNYPVVESLALYYEDFQQYSMIPISYKSESDGNAADQNDTNQGSHDNEEDEDYIIRSIDDVVLEMILLSSVEKTSFIPKVTPYEPGRTATSATRASTTPDRRSRVDDKIKDSMQFTTLDYEQHCQQALVSSFQQWKVSYQNVQDKRLRKKSVEHLSESFDPSHEIKQSTDHPGQIRHSENKPPPSPLQSNISTIEQQPPVSGVTTGIHANKKQRTMHGFSKLTTKRKPGGGRLQFSG